MYRTDLRSGEIKILYNGVGLVYETPKVLTEVLPDGSEKVWKKNIDISFDFNGESKRIYGFVGLLDEGSTSGAGFTLIRYGRVIVGGYEMDIGLKRYSKNPTLMSIRDSLES